MYKEQYKSNNKSKMSPLQFSYIRTESTRRFNSVRGETHPCIAITLIILWAVVVCGSIVLWVVGGAIYDGYVCPAGTFYMKNTGRCMDDDSKIHQLVYNQQTHDVGVALLIAAGVSTFVSIISTVGFCFVKRECCFENRNSFRCSCSCMKKKSTTNTTPQRSHTMV